MTFVHEITAAAGARKRRKRRGRGESSGLGKTAGRGNKGLQSRTGGGARPLTEGGQMPMFRRLPKRGFSNYNFRTEYQVVNVGVLGERFADGERVDVQRLREARLVHGSAPRVKILGDGALEKRLTVEAHAFSRHAAELIQKAGGTVSLIARRSPQEAAAAKRHTRRKAVAEGSRADARAGRRARRGAGAEPSGAEPAGASE